MTKSTVKTIERKIERLKTQLKAAEAELEEAQDVASYPRWVEFHEGLICQMYKEARNKPVFRKHPSMDSVLRPIFREIEASGFRIEAWRFGLGNVSLAIWCETPADKTVFKQWFHSHYADHAAAGLEEEKAEVLIVNESSV
jgi:hypothetical protein